MKADFDEVFTVRVTHTWLCGWFQYWRCFLFSRGIVDSVRRAFCKDAEGLNYTTFICVLGLSPNPRLDLKYKGGCVRFLSSCAIFQRNLQFLQRQFARWPNNAYMCIYFAKYHIFYFKYYIYNAQPKYFCMKCEEQNCSGETLNTILHI